MSKQIKHTARGLAALGRGEDKMLVHMTPREVGGLQQLAVASGGTLTINPKTGLPEAGWLSSLLPIVAAGAATFMTGGAASPWLIAALGAAGGGIGAKAEGEDPLMGAAMGALSGFGGSGLTKGLMQAGAGGAGLGAAGAQAGNASLQATNAAGQAAAQAANAAAPNVAGAASAAFEPVNISAQYIPRAMETGAKGFMGNVKLAGEGLKSLVQPGGATGQTLWSGVEGTSNKGLTGLEKLGTTTAAMNTLNAASASGGGGGGGKKSKPMYYHTSATIDPNGYTSFGPGYWSKDYNYETLGTNPQNGEKYAEVRKKNQYYAAEGGQVPSVEEYFRQQITEPINRPPVDTSANQAYMDKLNAMAVAPPPMPSQPAQQPIAATAPVMPVLGNTVLTKKEKKQAKKDAGRFGNLNTGKNAPPAPVHYNFSYENGFTPMKKGGIASLRKGKGDGVSDSIKTKIKSRRGNKDQAAALSDGEFVIPARHVSEIGNGSTDAGAKRLYAMMERIERRRRNTPYAEDSGSYKELPA